MKAFCLLEALDKEANQIHKILEQIKFSGAVKIIKEPCWNPFVAVWSQSQGRLEEIALRFCSGF
jgi:hypothetical protein